MTQEQAFAQCKARGWVKAVPMEWEGFCEITVESANHGEVTPHIVTMGRGATYEEALLDADRKVSGYAG